MGSHKGHEATKGPAQIAISGADLAIPFGNGVLSLRRVSDRVRRDVRHLDRAVIFAEQQVMSPGLSRSRSTPAIGPHGGLAAGAAASEKADKAFERSMRGFPCSRGAERGGRGEGESSGS